MGAVTLVEDGVTTGGRLGEMIRYAVADCSLGRVVVAATDVGVCLIAFADAYADLLTELGDRFPHAELLPGDAGFAGRLAEVVGCVDAPALGFGLPLDARGTAFQRRVWDELRAIPSGRTATYTEVAARIGRPTAARAVAGACAANPLAVVVPCHRVVRTGGAVSGYRWGVERKKELLRREAGQTMSD